LLILAELAKQVVELFRAPASTGCCCHGAAKMPVLRQRYKALALKFFPASAVMAAAAAQSTLFQKNAHRIFAPGFVAV